MKTKHIKSRDESIGSDRIKQYRFNNCNSYARGMLDQISYLGINVGLCATMVMQKCNSLIIKCSCDHAEVRW